MDAGVQPTEAAVGRRRVRGGWVERGERVSTRVLVGATGDVLARFEDPGALLTDDELARAARFRAQGHRDDFVAAHVLVRMCAGEALGVAPEELTLVQLCPTCGGTHGPPSLKEVADLAVSLSHTRGHVAATAGPGPVGVDIEAADRKQSDGLVDMVLAPAEARLVRAAADAPLAFLDLWVRKEALIKAGRASLNTLASVDLVGDAGRVVDRWGDLYLTGWRDGDRLVGACASPTPATIQMI